MSTYNYHRNALVGTQLIVSPRLRGIDRVLVETTTEDVLALNVVGGIERRIDRNVEPALERALHELIPLRVRQHLERLGVIVRDLDHDARVGEAIELREGREPPQRRLEETDDLDRGSVARRGRDAEGTGLARLAHLVHPGAAVVDVAAVQEAGREVEAHLNVEAIGLHLGIDLRAGVPLAEGDASRVALQDLLHEVEQGGRDVGVGGRRVLVEREARPHLGVLHKVDGLSRARVAERKGAVFLQRLKEPPHGVAGVVARIQALTQEVGDQAVSHARCEHQDLVERLGQPAGNEQ